MYFYTITENHKTIRHNAVDSEYDGYSSVEINEVSDVSVNNLQNINKENNPIIENGIYEYKPKNGYDGISKIKLKVNVP